MKKKRASPLGQRAPEKMPLRRLPPVPAGRRQPLKAASLRAGLQDYWFAGGAEGAAAPPASLLLVPEPVDSPMVDDFL